MAKNIYHWVDAQSKAHFADHLPSGQAAPEVANDVIANDAISAIPVSLNQSYVSNTTQAVNDRHIDFDNKSSSPTNPIGLFIIILIGIIYILKTDKKTRNSTNERFKSNLSTEELKRKPSFSNPPEGVETEKGLSGELTVSRILSSNFDKSTYRLINGVTLKTNDGTTQIDHIVVSRYGIFVIETKNMSGWIFGSANQGLWTQVLGHGKTKFRFQNPLHQNYKHIKTLEKLLRINSKKLFSLVVFVGDSQFKTEMPENVFDKDDIVEFIKNKTTTIFSDEEVSAIYNKINEARLAPTAKTCSDHIEHVQTIINRRQPSFH